MTLAVAEKQVRRRLFGARAGIIATLLGALLVLGGGAAPAYAHAELLETTPADGAVLEEAPPKVELRFNEPVKVVAGANRLFLSDGTRVQLDARSVDTSVVLTLPSGLGDGAYTLGYRVVSADGHPVGGALTFQVGEGAVPAPTAGVGTAAGEPEVTDFIVSVLQIAQYLGLFLFAGLLFFERVVLGAWLPRTRGYLTLLWGGLTMAVLSSLFLLPASGARVAGEELVRYVPDSGDLIFAPAAVWAPGVSWQLVAAAVSTTAFGLAALTIRSRQRRLAGASDAVPLTRSAWAKRPASWLPTVIAALALSSPLWVGHSQTVQPLWLMLLADFGHMLAGAYWVGGVVGLVAFLRARRSAAAFGVVSRFSRFALLSVLLLGTSGTVMAWLIVGSWTALFTTTYGLLLLIKLGLVAVIVLLAGLNRQLFLPRIARNPDAETRWIGLRRTLLYEAILLVGVVSVTGFLTNTSPNAETLANTSGHTHHHVDTTQATEFDVESQGLRVTGEITPSGVGTNTVAFSLEYAGAAIAPGSTGAEAAVVLEARLPAEQLGPFTAAPEFDAATGNYQAKLALPVAGEWQFQVRVRVDTYSEPIAVIPVTIR